MTDIVEWLRNAPSNEWNGEMLNKIADEIERLRTLMPIWQPIETAPSTGEALVWDGRYIYIADEPDKYPTDNDGKSAAYHEATHWMPMPPPPAERRSGWG